jgi:hypothetical protein
VKKTIKTPLGTVPILKEHHRTPPVYEIECPRGCGKCLWGVKDIDTEGRWRCPYCRKKNPLAEDAAVIAQIKMEARDEMRNGKQRRDIHNSTTWNKLRYLVLKRDGGRCCLCGRGVADGVKLHVDHIIPASICPERYYDPDNLQTLCEECNLGKSDLDSTDWR